MEQVMTIAWRALAMVVVLGSAWPLAAAAQDVQPPAGAPKTGPWLMVGGTSTTLLGDCTDCSEGTYLHSGGVIAQGGISVNRRADLGGELFWTDATLSSGDHVRATFVMGVVQFRPWHSRGFFLKGGAGMAFIRNWLDTFGEAPPSQSKALGIEIGAGWEWRTRSRVGVQVFGGHHVAALGDLETSDRTLQNVVSNMWSIGAAIVIR
jgi:hypothetical protein